LTATFSPIDAANRSITWVSGNTGVATVDSSGVVTSVAKGTAVITAKTEEGRYSDSSIIIVHDPIAVTGVTLSPSSDKIFFFPNPVKNYVTVTIPEPVTTGSDLKIFDNTGRIIKSVNMKGTSYDLDMTGFNRGLYYIVIYSNGKIFRNKILKD